MAIKPRWETPEDSEAFADSIMKGIKEAREKHEKEEKDSKTEKPADAPAPKEDMK